MSDRHGSVWWRPWQVIGAGWQDLFSRPVNQVAALDGLRALAVLLVIFDHFAVTVWHDTGIGNGWWLRTPPFRYGWSGVDLFFVLSGFLIGGQLWRERMRTGSIDFRRFFTRRAMRIWPLYFVTLVAMALGAGHLAPRWPDWFLMSNYFGTPYARSWSLSTEEMFYLAVPVLVMLLPRLRVRTIAVALVGMLILVDVNRILAFRDLASEGVSSQQIALHLYGPFHTHNQGLLIGLLLALVATHLPRWVTPSQGRAPSPVGIAALGLLLGLAATARGLGGQALSFTALALIYGGLAYFVLVDRSVLSAPFRWRLCFPLARLSYGMYLNHLVFGWGAVTALLGYFKRTGAPPSLAFAAGLGFTIATSAAFAVVTFLVVEHPFLLLREHILKRPRPLPV